MTVNGNLYYEKALQKQDDDQIEFLTKALDAGDLSFELTAQAYAKRGEALRKKGKLEKAVSDFNSAIEIDSQYDWAYWRRGIAYRQKNAFESAIADLNKAIEINAKLGSAYASRGETYRRMGQFEDAISDFNTAIEIDPDCSWAYAYLGKTYRQKGNHEKAITYLTRAIGLDPEYSWAYAERGETYRKEGEFGKSIEDLSRAILINPKDAWAYDQRGLAYKQTGDFDKAIADFDRSIELYPDHEWTYAKRGDAYRQKGKFQKAIKDLTRAIQIDPKYGWAYDMRGETYKQQGDFDKAIADFDCSLELYPDDEWTYAKRGDAYRQKGKFQKAIKDLTRAIQIDPKYRWAYDKRGESYKQKGDFEKAIKDYNQAILLDPDNEWAYTQRKETYLLKKDAVDDALIEQLFLLSGIDCQIQQIPALIETEFDIATKEDSRINKFPRSVVSKIKASIKTAFVRDQIKRHLVEEFKAKLSRDDIAAALNWFTSAVGRKIVTTEAAAGAPENYTELLSYMEQLNASPPSKKRLQLISDLDSVLKVSENAAAIAENMQKAFVIAFLESKPKEQQPSPEQLTRILEKERPNIHDEAKARTIISLFYTFKDFSEVEVREYTAFASSLPGIIFHHSVTNGFKNALVEGGYVLGEIMAEILEKSEGNFDI